MTHVKARLAVSPHTLKRDDGCALSHHRPFIDSYKCITHLYIICICRRPRPTTWQPSASYRALKYFLPFLTTMPLKPGATFCPMTLYTLPSAGALSLTPGAAMPLSIP